MRSSGVILIRAHKAAVLARLREDPVLAGCTFDGQVSGDPQRYCYVFMDSGRRRVSRLSGPSSSARFTVTVHSVGRTPDGAAAVQERVIDRLVDFVPVVAGRLCSRMEHGAVVPVGTDGGVRPSQWFGTDEFYFSSDPV